MHVYQVIIGLIYFSSLVVISVIGYLTYQQRGTGTTNSLFFVTAAGFTFIFSSFLIIVSNAEPIMRFGIWLLAPSHWIFGLAIALFTLNFTGYYQRLTNRAIYSIYGVYGTLTLISATIPFHDLIVDSYGLSTDPFPYVYATPSIGMPVFLGIGYAMNFAIAVIFIMAMFESTRVSYRQFLTLSFIAGATSFIHFAEYIFYEPTLAAGPFGVSAVFIIAGFGYLVFCEDLLTLDPITRRDIVSTLAQPVILTDSNGCIVDYNTSAETHCPSLDGSAGQLIEDVKPDLIETVPDDPEETRTFADELSLTTPDGGFREFQVSSEQVFKDGRFFGTTLVLNDVTDLKMYAQNLEQQTDQLEDFTSFVSHDLRNPIATSRQYIGMLEGKNEEEKRYISDIDDALDRMDTMIENLLTLTREGQAIKDRSTVSLPDTISYAWRISDTQEANLESYSLANTTIYADKNRLYTLFENLFRNAAEHAGPNTNVFIGVLPKEGEIYIADDGPGLPDSIDIFQKGATTSPAGTGLGLAIVERIVEAHGWEINASQFEETGGAKFTISGIKSLQKQRLNGSSDYHQSAKM